MFLSNSVFANIVKYTPLVAIDLVIYKRREILIGKRLNSPAKDFFFVPGGRIYKNELRKRAFLRILMHELGMKIRNDHDKFIKEIGFYEHFYDDNFLGNKEFGTHYLVIVYLIPHQSLISTKSENKYEQHSEFIWLDIDKIDESNLPIHIYTKEYLKNPILKNIK